MAIKLQPKLIRQRSTTPPALAKNSSTRMLTRDLFAVANLIVELSSIKHAHKNNQNNCHQYNT